jgi:FHA domain-containing protein/von Willebrand factor type A domain-containing protein
MWRCAPTIFVALALAGASARADKPRCRLERIDAEALRDERLKVYASVVELEGQVVEGVNAGEFVLRVDGKASGRAEKVQLFAQAREEVDVALVVEVAAQYRKALDPVKEALRDFLSDQPPTMKVSLITFGSDIDRKTPRFIGAPMMSGELDDLSPDDDSVEVKMVDAVHEALRQLKKVEPPEGSGRPTPRRLIVLVSDGLNVKMDRATFKRLGDEAQKASVPIHTIAFSPIDERGPLLNLGELSKRSHGTFRWARTGDDFKGQLDTLADEVRKQYVITFKSSLSSTEKHVFSLLCRDLHSNPLGGAHAGEGGGGGLRWYWWVLIGLAGALLALFLLGSYIQSREKRVAAPGAPRPAPSVKQPVPVQPGRTSGVPVVGSGGQRPAPQPAAAPPAARSATLFAVTGGLSGQRWPIRGALTVGKGAGHAITVNDDPTVSTNHCELRAEGAGFVVRDLGSTNGTFVNGRRITAPQWVNDGDLIRCGLNTQFKLRFD